MRAPRRPVIASLTFSALLLAAPAALLAAPPASAAEAAPRRSVLADAVAEAGSTVEALPIKASQDGAAGKDGKAKAKAEASPTKPAAPLLWPMRGEVTSEFGMRWGRPHKGIDIAAPIGTPVVAPADGVVIGHAWMSGYGLALHLDHGNGVSTFYGHLQIVGQLVPGQAVGKGDTVALSGNTGRSTAPHLHFEVRVGPTHHNPREFLTGQPKPLV